MPITFQVRPDENLIEARFEGDFNEAHLRDYNVALRQHPGFQPGIRELVVLHAIRPSLSFAEMQRHKLWLAGLAPIGRTAIVALGAFEYGMARMFPQVADSPTDISVFHDESSALEWLGVAASR